jgi:CubicO group peptidase (beta-lactamase class C family)
VKSLLTLISRKATFVLSAICATYAMAAHANPYQAIDNYVIQNKETIRLNSGTAVVLIKDNEIVYEGYFGFADLEKQTAVNEDTVFYIASMTKPFTSLLALLLEQKGTLRTERTVAEMFPDLEFKRSLRAEQVTVRDLLSHTSGMDNWPLIQATAYTGLYDKTTIDKILRASYVNDRAPLGEFDYTNVGYNILSHWMDNNLGSDWQSLLETHLFKPLKMDSTSARISDAHQHNWTLAKGYSIKSPEPTDPVYLTKTDKTMHAAGGIISTARDLAQFLIMQVNKGQLDGEQILPESVVTKSQQKVAQHDWFGDKRYYGWGWFFRESFGNTLLEHRGGYLGASTYMSFMPEQKTGLVVLSNQDKWGGDLAYALESIGYAIALGKSENEISELVDKYQTRATEKAQKHYAGKNTSLPALAINLNSDYVGTYEHETLGQIQVSKQKNQSVLLQWGNLKSQLYTVGTPRQLSVEFIPNSHDEVVFLNGTNNQQRLQYRDYIFTKKGEE